MNLKNKATGRTIQVPDAPEEKQIFVSVVNGELRMREDGRGPLLTEADIVHRAEEARRRYAQRELEQSNLWTVLWLVIGAVIVVGAGAWVVDFMREAFAVKPKVREERWQQKRRYGSE